MGMRILLAATAVLLAALSIAPFPGERETVIFEAEAFSEIAAPMRVADDAEGAGGGACIELPLGSGQGWRGEALGHVTYRVEVAKADAYTVWARVLWQDGCTNAFFMRVEGGPRLVVGNDAIFGAWHWVNSAPMAFAEGLNHLRVENHSDGTALDKLIVTNDPLFEPEGLGGHITRFYDGFGGCDGDNTGSWEFVSGRWRVFAPQAGFATGLEDTLTQLEPAGGAAYAGYASWADYDASVKFRLSGPSRMGLTLYAHEASETAVVVDATGSTPRLAIEHYLRGECVERSEAPIAQLAYDNWYTLGYHQESGSAVASLDGDAVVAAPPPPATAGRAGLIVYEGAGVFFDNVDIRFR